MISGAEREAKTLGTPLEVQAPAQETDKERQFAIVQDLTARHVDAILIAPADSKAIVPALKKAQDAGITVINLDNRVDAQTVRAAGLKLGGYVGADNEAGGKMAGEALSKALGGKGQHRDLGHSQAMKRDSSDTSAPAAPSLSATHRSGGRGGCQR